MTIYGGKPAQEMPLAAVVRVMGMLISYVVVSSGRGLECGPGCLEMVVNTATNDRSPFSMWPKVRWAKAY